MDYALVARVVGSVLGVILLAGALFISVLLIISRWRERRVEREDELSAFATPAVDPDETL